MQASQNRMLAQCTEMSSRLRSDKNTHGNNADIDMDKTKPVIAVAPAAAIDPAQSSTAPNVDTDIVLERKRVLAAEAEDTAKKIKAGATLVPSDNPSV